MAAQVLRGCVGAAALSVVLLVADVYAPAASAAPCSIDGTDLGPVLGESASVCGSTDWLTVQLDAFEDGGAPPDGWSGGSGLACGKFGPVLEVAAPTAGAAAAATRVFALELEPHTHVLITLDVLAPLGFGGGAELTLAAGEPGGPRAVVWTSAVLGGALPPAWPSLWVPWFSAAAACGAGAAGGGVALQVAAVVPHTGSALEVRLELALADGGASAPSFAVDNVRLAVPAVVAVGEAGAVASVDSEPTVVRLRGVYVRAPVVLVGAAPTSAAGVVPRVVVLQENSTASATEIGACSFLTGPGGQFRSCGGACVPRASCWDDADGCDALLPQGGYESCCGRCVPRGGCGWRFEVFLQTCGGTEADLVASLSWLAVEPGVHWSETDSQFVLQVGSVDVSTVAFSPVAFDDTFVAAVAKTDRAVALVSSLQTLSSGDVFLSPRHSGTNASGFHAVLQGSDRLILALDGTVTNGLPRLQETLGWLAATEGFGGGFGASVTFEATAVSLSSEPAELVFRSSFVQPSVFASVLELYGLDSVHVKTETSVSSTAVALSLDEDTCQDAEVEHATEPVGVLLVGFDASINTVLRSSLINHLDQVQSDQVLYTPGDSCGCSDELAVPEPAGASSTCADARSRMAEQRQQCSDEVIPGQGISLDAICPVTCAVCGPDTNIALAKSVTADSTADGLGPARATDGCVNSESRWVSSNEQAEHWLIIDLLGAPSLLVRAVIVHLDETFGNCELALDVFEVAAQSWQVVATAVIAEVSIAVDACASLSIPGQKLQNCGGACVPRYSCWDDSEGSRSLTFANLNVEASSVRLRVDVSNCEAVDDRHARIRDVSVLNPCPQGYVADGSVECRQANPCEDAASTQMELCDSNSQCTHAGPDHFVCACKVGWTRQSVADGVDTSIGVCVGLSTASGAEFKSCGGACVPRESCWDDADGCDALLPQGGYESCCGRCVPRGGCGWAYSDPCVDVTPPVLECPAAFSAVADLGSAYTTVTVPLPTVLDDSDWTLEFSLANGTLTAHTDVAARVISLRIGENTVGWRAIDSRGNNGACYVVMTVLDLEAPQIGLCGVAASVTAGRGRLQATLDLRSYGEGIQLNDNSGGIVTVNAWLDILSTDDVCSALGDARFSNCYGSCVPRAECWRGEPYFATTPLAVGQHSLVIQAEDPSGNSGDSCRIEVEVADFDECQDPSTPNGDCWVGLQCVNEVGRAVCSDCPAGLFGNRWPSVCHLQDPCDEDLAAVWPGEQLGQHQCDPFADCAQSGSGEDAFGKYTCTCRSGFVGSGFLGDCADTQTPAIACAFNVTAATEPSEAFATVVIGPLPEISDNAGADAVTTIIHVNHSGVLTATNPGVQHDFDLDGASEIIYTSTDVAGNIGICATEILVEDREPPVMVCPNMTLQANPWMQNVPNVLVEPVSVQDNSGEAVSLSVSLPQNITVLQNVSVFVNIAEVRIAKALACVDDAQEVVANLGITCALAKTAWNCDGRDLSVEGWPVAIGTTIPDLCPVTCDACVVGNATGNFSIVTRNVSISQVDMQLEHRTIAMSLASSASHLFVWTASTSDGLMSQCTTEMQVQDTNECTDVATANNGGCSNLRTCIDTVGGRLCDMCPPGWIPHANLSATDCDSINPCLPSDNPCDSHAGCSHAGPGAYLCSCHIGYTGNGSDGFCTDVTAPVIVCADDLILDTDPGNNTAILELPLVTAYDSATGPLLVTLDFTNNSMLISQPANATMTTWTARLRMGTTTIEYAAVDEAGNRAACLWTARVVDTEPPVIEHCMDVLIVAPPFEDTGHPFLDPGLQVEVWSPGQPPEPPIDDTLLGTPLITAVWTNVNQSATLTAFPGFQGRRDRFVAFFRGYVDISRDGNGQYLFAVDISDGDGTALLVNGLRVDNGQPIFLTGPMVSVELQYVETVGLAEVILHWQRPGQSEREVVPAQVLHHTVLRGWPTIVEDNSELSVRLHIEDHSGATLGIPSAFAFGHRVLQIVGTDQAGNRASCGINITVEDRDECVANNGGCDDVAVCTNQPGSRLCSPCPFGFDGNGYNDGGGCTLVNQCLNTTGVAHNCTAVAACSLLSPGIYTCTCPAGYVGDGYEIGTGIAHSGCTDVAAPVLTCPGLIVAQAWPDAQQAWVTVQLQEARDNSGAAPLISATRIFDEVATSIVMDAPQQFPVGTSAISVVAQDADSNTAGCIGEVQVQPIVSVTVPTRMHYLYEGRMSSVVVYMYHLGSAPESNTTVVEVLAYAADTAKDFLYLDSPRTTYTQANWSTCANLGLFSVFCANLPYPVLPVICCING